MILDRELLRRVDSVTISNSVILETSYTKSFNINRLRNHGWRIWSPYGAPHNTLIYLIIFHLRRQSLPASCNNDPMMGRESAIWRRLVNVTRTTPQMAAAVITAAASPRNAPSNRAARQHHARLEIDPQKYARNRVSCALWHSHLDRQIENDLGVPLVELN